MKFPHYPRPGVQDARQELGQTRVVYRLKELMLARVEYPLSKRPGELIRLPTYLAGRAYTQYLGRL
jgi:hypothetical protein